MWASYSGIERGKEKFPQARTFLWVLQKVIQNSKTIPTSQFFLFISQHTLKISPGARNSSQHNWLPRWIWGGYKIYGGFEKSYDSKPAQKPVFRYNSLLNSLGKLKFGHICVLIVLDHMTSKSKLSKLRESLQLFLKFE